MKKLSIIVAVLVILATAIPTTAVVGSSDNGLLDDEWYLDLNNVYGWGWLGATPAIVNLPGVDNYGVDPASDLEIVTGSDGFSSHLNPTVSAPGLWRAIDSKGNIEWYRNTQSDEARGSVAITDLNGDGNLEIVGGTTSGHTIEVMDRFGNFVWTFPKPPVAGGFEWSSGAAVADLNPGVSGLEVVAVHRPTGNVVVLDGDNSDVVNDGILFTGLDGYTFTGTEGTDWDVLWKYDMGGSDNHGSAAIGDVDNDGALEVVAGSQNGNVYVLNGATGTVEATFTTTSVQASPALANLDSDPYLEIVIGNLAGTLYVFEWDGTTASTQSSINLGLPIYSSAAIGNIDSDSDLEIVVGTGGTYATGGLDTGGKVYALNAALNQEWVYPSTGSAGMFYASPSLADTTSVSPYDIEWQMFRHDAKRTGYYGSSANPLDVFIGSMDGYLYLLNGNDGTLIDRFQSSGPIHGSPTVGDVDGDGKLNIIFQSWGGSSTTIYDRLWNVEIVSVVVNQPPVANANGPYTGNEGSAITFDAGASTDPEGNPLQYRWDFDNDGTWDTEWSTSPTASYTWNDDYSGTAKVEVSDGALTDTATASVTVNNVAPSVDAGADQTVNEGDTVSFSGSYSDPAGALDAPYTVEWNFGDGTTASETLTPSHVYADNGAYTVTLTVTDNDGGPGTDTLTVTVNNVAPTVGPITTAVDPVPIGTSITATASFTDPGTADTHTAVWNWGDGTTPGTVTEASGSGSVSDTHTYTTPGIYTIVLTVTDDDGGAGSSEYHYVVIYDPNGGFVTGGGWINSPAGAYVADTTLTGKANFGFVSKYLKGANVPTGNTEFQFKVANLNFHSKDYEWLVVAGARAQYKGTGTINGEGSYGFMLTAIDGQINGGGGMDRFRIKIWDKTTDALTYDNVLGASDDVDAGSLQAIGGGSIVIHNT